MLRYRRTRSPPTEESSSVSSTEETDSEDGNNEEMMLFTIENDGTFEAEPTYEVEKILDDRPSRMMGCRQYFVHWKDYDSSHDSWVDEDQLLCPKLLSEYRKKKQLELLTRKSRSRSKTPTTAGGQKASSSTIRRGSTKVSLKPIKPSPLVEKFPHEFNGKHPDTNLRYMTNLYLKKCKNELIEKQKQDTLIEPQMNEYIPEIDDVGFSKGWQAISIIRQLNSTHVSVQFKESQMYQIIPIKMVAQYRIDLIYKYQNRSQ